MEELLAIFDKEILDQGLIIKENIEKDYDWIENLFDVKELPRQKFGIYYLYPYLFKHSFEELTFDKFNIIAQAGVFVLDNILYLDSIIDSQFTFDFNSALQKNFVMQYANRLLSTLFDIKSEFWKFYEDYFAEYVKSVKMEKANHYNKISEYSYDEFRKIAIGKSAVAKATVVALACLTQKIDKIKELEKAQDLFSEAFQLYDDLKDIDNDYATKNISWILNKIITENGLELNSDIKHIKYILFSKNYDLMVIDRILTICNEAILCSGVNEYLIREIIVFRDTAERMRKKICTIKKLDPELNFYKKETEEVEIHEALLRGYSFLKSQYRNSFFEINHFMGFPHSQGFTAKEFYVKGDVFQKSFALNLILESQELFSFTAKDTELLWEDIRGKKSEYHTWGYSYFAGLPELPPDVDTFSEILKNLKYLNLNNREISNVDEIINHILKNNYSDEGYVTTWILNLEDTDYNERAVLASEKYWGRTVDVEVCANFAYALTLYDYEKYKEIITKLLDYMVKYKDASGVWKSTWYSSDYYTGYLLSKIFSILSCNKEELYEYFIYLKSADNLTNSIDIALIISSLIELNEVFKEDIEARLCKLTLLLIENMQVDGYWDAKDFIKMNLGKSQNSQDEARVITFKSSILTTFICLSALDKFKRRNYFGCSE